MLFGTHFAWGVITYIALTNLGLGTPEALTGSFLSHKAVDSFKASHKFRNTEVLMFVSITDNLAVTEVLKQNDDMLLLAGLVGVLPDAIKYLNRDLMPWMHQNTFTHELTNSQTIAFELMTLTLLHITLKEYKVDNKVFKLNLGVR